MRVGNYQKKISESQKDEIYILTSQKKSRKFISEKLGVTDSTVGYWRRKMQINQIYYD